jgi:hypothetical protein
LSARVSESERERRGWLSARVSESEREEGLVEWGRTMGFTSVHDLFVNG